MGQLLDGQWKTGDFGINERGEFVRKAAKFRRRISTGSEHPPAAGRYHLYAAHACGWCHRVLLWRALKGLEDAVSLSWVEPLMTDELGWTIAEGEDVVLGKRRLAEVYLEADPKYTGRVTVPVLWDREKSTIVNNESTDLIVDFDGELDAFAKAPQRHFFSVADREAIDEMVQLNYEAVNNGVYRCGFARSQAAYDEAAAALFHRLDQLEELLSKQRYLMGDELSAADLCLFPTLYRFDSVYSIHFKCSRRRLVDYPSLWAYTRDIYQEPGVAQTCDMQRTKEHYYRSHESVHPRGFVPLTPELDFEAVHNRG